MGAGDSGGFGAGRPFSRTVRASIRRRGRAAQDSVPAIDEVQQYADYGSPLTRKTGASGAQACSRIGSIQPLDASRFTAVTKTAKKHLIESDLPRPAGREIETELAHVPLLPPQG